MLLFSSSLYFYVFTGGGTLAANDVGNTFLVGVRVLIGTSKHGTTNASDAADHCQARDPTSNN